MMILSPVHSRISSSSSLLLGATVVVLAIVVCTIMSPEFEIQGFWDRSLKFPSSDFNSALSASVIFGNYS